jgi:hypothetical protein
VSEINIRINLGCNMSTFQEQTKKGKQQKIPKKKEKKHWPRNI